MIHYLLVNYCNGILRIMRRTDIKLTAEAWESASTENMVLTDMTTVH